MTHEPPHTLDARHLLCPMPVIRTQDKIKQLQPGEYIEVSCTDPGAMYDIPAWCRVHGHTIVKAEQQQLDIVILIKVN